MHKGIRLVLFLVLLGVVACKPGVSTQGNNTSLQNLSFSKTEEGIYSYDGLKLAATLYETKEKRPVMVFLHMLGSNQSAYNVFVQKALEQNYSAITFDFRGHGLSDGELDKFTNDDFKKFGKDLDAVLQSASEKEFMDTENIILVGASIGANIALQHAANDSRVKFVIMLSPGLDYRGIKIDKAIMEYGDKPLEVVASEGDTYSFSSSRFLMDNTPSFAASFRSFKGSLHGTDLLTEKLMEDLLEDIKGAVSQ